MIELVRFGDLHPDLDTKIALDPGEEIVSDSGARMPVCCFGDVTFLKMEVEPVSGMNAVMLEDEKFHSFVFINPDVRIVNRRCRKKRGIFCFLEKTAAA